jgi:predicted hotdog family 3-hydroxylacyl-ACP dehydratase
MMLPVSDIIPLIPQKPPFVMVGHLLYADETTARSGFTIERGNVFVKNNLFQEAGLLENMAQTAALGAGYMAKKADNPVTAGYIGAVKDFEVLALPEVGDELVTEITIENHIFDITVLSGKVWHNNNLLAKCEMKVVTGTK